MVKPISQGRKAHAIGEKCIDDIEKILVDARAELASMGIRFVIRTDSDGKYSFALVPLNEQSRSI